MSRHLTARRRVLTLVAGVALVGGGLPLLPSGSAVAAGPLPAPLPAPVQRGVVNPVPVKKTPQLLDGKVIAIAQVGTTVLVGGTFTRSAPPSGTPVTATPKLIAFDEATGVPSATFLPNVTGGEVQSLAPGPTAGTAYVGGSFNSIGGVNVRGLALVDVATGQLVPGFARSATNGQVNSLKLVGSRLYAGGTFTSFNGVARNGLVALNASTGVLDPFLAVKLTGHHNYNGTGANDAVGADTLDVTADGRSMVVIGNFKNADGLLRDQVVMIDLSGAAAAVRADWRTRSFEMTCNRGVFDSSVRGMAIAPDGQTFTVVSTGGPSAGTCDTAAAFSTTATGDDVKPIWVDYTGGDSLYGVAMTGDATYVGGHNRWMNNPGGSDRASAGAVPRPSLSALSPKTGVPLSWNPGRHPRGLGVMVLYATPAGLWMGGDTDWVGNFEYKRPKLAFFPLAGGSAVVPETTQQLPGGLFQGSGTTLTSRSYDGTTVAGPLTVPSSASWAGVRAATLIGSALYYPKSDDKLYRRTFDGKAFGAETLVDPYNDPKWATQATGSGTSVYRGVTPWSSGELANIDSMWFADGRLYYVLRTSSGLYSRAFNPDSGIAHATRGQALGVSLTSTVGGFVAGGNLYLASSSTGNLSRVTWANGAPSGASTVVSGPATGVDYRGTVLFLGPAFAANAAPTAAITVNCSNNDCTYDAAGSADADGAVTSYAWSFGDGGTATGATAAHHYAAAGSYPVTLTVTDNGGATATASRALEVTAPPTSSIVFRGAAGKVATFTNVTVTTPAAVQAGDAMALLVTTATAATVTAPAGWTQLTAATATDQTTTVYTKTAAAADAGAAVKVTLSATVKVTAQLVAYGGARATGAVSAVAAASTGDSTTWTAPAAPVPANGSWAVWYWAGKSSTTLTWTGPPGSTTRDTQAGAGTGNVSSVIADLGTARPAGTVPAAVATSSAPATRGTAVTLVITPAA